MKVKLDKTDIMFAVIKARLTKIKGDFASLVNIKTQVQEFELLAEENAKQMSHLSSRLDDKKDRARRQNFLFSG